MDQINVSLGIGEISTTYIGYKKLHLLYETCRQYREIPVFLDFSNIRWIDGNMSALLEAIVYDLSKRNELKFLIDVDDLSSRFTILFRNGLLNHLTSSNHSASTCVPLTGFHPNDDVKFYNYISNELLTHRSLRIDNIQKEELKDHFAEIFTNVQKHAQTSEPVFVCGQFYPKKRELAFSLIDLGVGYLPPIQEFTQNQITTSSDAILWAIAGNTTKIDAPGGLGLKELIKFCDSTKSKISIITGGSFWSNHSGRSMIYNVPKYKGTMVNVIFRCIE